MLKAQIDSALSLRNKYWESLELIPNWVDTGNVSLDQFFTKPEVAHKCYKNFIAYLQKNDVKTSNYTFLEPAVGAGAFYDLLPANKFGLDILPLSSEIMQQDFLSWSPNKNKKYIAIGNPPFGYRGWLALAFMNKVAEFCDYAAFILPMSFQSEGKGSPKNRVKGMRLVHSQVLDQDSFISPQGKTLKINALWQIWEKGENTIQGRDTCKDWLELFTVDMRKERLCGQDKINKADFFLQRTFYNEPPKLVKTFDKVKYVCGYGLIIKKDKKRVIKALNEVDWNQYSNLAAHNCRHISMYHIEKALTDEGFVDV